LHSENHGRRWNNAIHLRWVSIINRTSALHTLAIVSFVPSGLLSLRETGVYRAFAHGGFSFLVEWILAEQATRGFQALKIREDRFIIDDCDSSSVVPGQIRALGLMM